MASKNTAVFRIYKSSAQAERAVDRLVAAGLLSVHCDTSNEISRAKDLLQETGAEDISTAIKKAVSSRGVSRDSVSTRV